MIQLTQVDRTKGGQVTKTIPVWVNPEQIVSLRASRWAPEGTDIGLVLEAITVTETPEEVVSCVENYRYWQSQPSYSQLPVIQCQPRQPTTGLISSK